MAGDQLPLIPLVELSGKGAKAAPSQTGFTAAKAGNTSGFTVMAMVLLVAHCPAFGVKV